MQVKVFLLYFLFLLSKVPPIVALTLPFFLIIIIWMVNAYILSNIGQRLIYKYFILVHLILQTTHDVCSYSYLKMRKIRQKG